MSGQDEIANQVAAAERDAKAKRSKKRKPRTSRRFPFKVDNGRVCRQVETEGADGNPGKRWVPFCTELRVEALTRNTDGEAWGRLLTVVDRDGRAHEWAMPLAMLAGDGRDLRAELMDLGLEPLPGVGRRWKDWLLEYLIGADPDARARCVHRVGWHGAVFVLPDETIGTAQDNDRVILQSAARLEHAFEVAGTLEGWKDELAARAVGNSRLMFFISAAFASPLLALTNEDGGGFHLRGGSSMGKSTALVAAGSVWGGGAPQGYIRSWRTTDNGVEATAALHNGTALCLDELSQLDPRAAAPAAYMLANGQGKARAGREGQARRAQEWRLIFLSTGEVALGDKVKEAGGRIAAGMEVRIIDLRADAGQGLGLFEDIHQAHDAASFAQELKAAAGRNYGHAARAFLRGIAGDLPGFRDRLEPIRREFVKAALTGPADGQVRRVLDRFALTAAAGEMATNLGITGWQPGEAARAALRCFADWLAERGGAGASEVTEAKRRLAEAIETFGAARFQKWHVNADRAVITPRWGFVKVQDDRGETLKDHEWFLTPSALTEVLSGLDRSAMIRALIAEGVIVAQGGNPNKTWHVPNAGTKMRLYQVNAVRLGTYDPKN